MVQFSYLFMYLFLKHFIDLFNDDFLSFHQRINFCSDWWKSNLSEKLTQLLSINARVLLDFFLYGWLILISTHLGLFYAHRSAIFACFIILFTFLLSCFLRFLHTVKGYQEFLSNTNNQQTPQWFQVILSEINLNTITWF